MRAIYLDCFSGISGNMLLGALLDIGLPEAALRDELAKLPVDGYDLQVNRVTKCGISATYVDVVLAKHSITTVIFRTLWRLLKNPHCRMQ